MLKLDDTATCVLKPIPDRILILWYRFQLEFSIIASFEFDNSLFSFRIGNTKGKINLVQEKEMPH